MRAEDEMKEIFNQDMRDFKAHEPANLLRQIAWAAVAIVVLIGVTGKMEQDIETFKAEQAYKLERE